MLQRSDDDAADRASIIEDLLRHNMQVHDLAIGLVGLPTPPDLTMQQVRVLSHVIKQPGISQQELGGFLAVSAPTASGLVERLTDKGLILRTDDAVDRRVRRLHATEAGLDVMRQMDSMFQRVLQVVLDELSLDDLDVLRRASRAMVDALQRVRMRQAG